MIQTIEENYPGFDRKVRELPIYYKALKVSLQHDSIETYSEFLNKSKQYISFFKDPHISISKVDAIETVPNTGSIRNNLNTKFELFDDEIAYLKIKSFDKSYKSEIDSIISSNLTKILRSEGLIIDLRGNRGGEIQSIDLLLSLIFHEPNSKVTSVIPYTTSNYYDVMDFLNISPDSILDPSKSDYNEMRVTYSFGTYQINIKKRRLKLKKYAILVDSNTASVSEVFIILARKSYNVKTFGCETHGAFDYGLIDQIELIKDKINLKFPRAKLIIDDSEHLYEERIIPDFILSGKRDHLEQVIEYFVDSL